MHIFFKKIFILCPLIFLFCISEAQNITGTWQGILDVRETRFPSYFISKRIAQTNGKRHLTAPVSMHLTFPVVKSF